MRIVSRISEDLLISVIGKDGPGGPEVTEIRLYRHFADCFRLPMIVKESCDEKLLRSGRFNGNNLRDDKQHALAIARLSLRWLRATVRRSLRSR
jgi:hypothetical protein